ncbi:DUF2867 domain-containing protein [Aquimarina aquimarini]|uniref:DUF2867 domain-containing protein n=1 Tax=Aquimarina aquimarini TaxID=1191734 RepID=UPI000D55EDF7|nr:DUF2867 domain-containing protein [Aquimarina aquimarini]
MAIKKVIEEQLYQTEKSKQLFPKIDFADTFSTINHCNTIEEITNLIFKTTPKWVAWLFGIRNKVVKFFGINESKPDDYNEDFKVGGYIGFFKIFYLTDDEIILGADESHLNFRAVIKNDHLQQYNVKVTTLVEFNSRKGKIYMGIVKPFHRLVVKRMVRNAYAVL